VIIAVVHLILICLLSSRQVFVQKWTATLGLMAPDHEVLARMAACALCGGSIGTVCNICLRSLVLWFNKSS
jgi:hypothetical protein